MKKCSSYSKKRSGSKRRSGGYTSASNYMLKTVGTGAQQYNNVFDISKNHSQSNAVVGLQGQKAGRRRTRSRSSSSSRKRSRSSSRKRQATRTQKGGFFTQMINTALVPLSILGLQQKYGRNTRKRR